MTKILFLKNNLLLKREISAFLNYENKSNNKDIQIIIVIIKIIVISYLMHRKKYK